MWINANLFAERPMSSSFRLHILLEEKMRDFKIPLSIHVQIFEMLFSGCIFREFTVDSNQGV